MEELKAKGWTEDAFCFTASSFIDQPHPIFSSQKELYPSINVDGYFFSWPKDSESLLTRKKNDLPILLDYPLEKGRVYLTTLYSDWAYSNWQYTQDELYLFREILSYARSSKPIPSFRKERIDIAISEGILLSPSKIPIATITTPGTITILPDEQGIYLLRKGTTTLPCFAVSSFISAFPNTIRPSLWVSESALRAQTITCNLNLKNIESQEDTFFISYNLSHKEKGNLGTQTIPIGEERNITFSIKEPLSSNISPDRYRLWSYIFDNKGAYLGYSTAEGRIINESAKIITNHKPEYLPGEKIELKTQIENRINFVYTSTLYLSVYDPNNLIVYSTQTSIPLVSYGTKSDIFSFNLLEDPIPGSYRILAYLERKGWSFSIENSYFNIPKKELFLSLSHSTFIKGTNTIAFILENTGKVDIPKATFTLSFKDPFGSTIGSITQNLSLLSKGSLTISFSFCLPD
ncbi:MAG: hypothetical protein AAB267_04120, partial [Candidatus Desantisbacteria bacterium]